MKYCIEVYGCTANKSDAALVKGVLNKKGHKLVETIDQADVIIILTCTVINTTEQRMLSRLKKLKKTGKKIIVGGCMPAVQSSVLKKIVPEAALLPPNKVQQISDFLEEKNKNITELNEDKTVYPKKYDSVNAPVMISEGCMFSCSYCITCKARGKLRSFPAGQIKKKVLEALKQNCKEIRITAQDTASYGLDIGTNLGFLLKDIVEIKDEYKIRVGMMNPFTLQKNFNRIVEGFKNPKIYNFLHIPVQSGSNKILEKMNRKYTVEDFKKIVKKFRESIPDLTVATDIIVGFPSENKQDFQKTVDLLENVKPDVTNITRFSARPLTSAKKMKQRVDTKVVKERSRFLTDLCSYLSKKNNEKFVGKSFDVLLTEKGKNKSIVGRNKNYKTVVLKNVDFKIGETVNVEIINAESTYLVGNI